MVAALRFAYCFLESLFRRVRDDGFSSEKALEVLGCAEIAVAFTIANSLFLAGVRWSRLDFGVPVAMAIGLLVIVLNHLVVFRGRGLEGYRQAYKDIPAVRRASGGAAVIIFIISAVVGSIVAGVMVANVISP